MTAVMNGPRRAGRAVGAWWHKLSNVWRVALSGGLAIVLIAAIVVLVTTGGPKMMTISADFNETPGLYPGNAVDILGINVGKIVSVKPNPSDVVVRMRIRASDKLPANVGAFLMAPNVVNDRYVQLDPPWTSGPVLADGAVIPQQRTAVPVSVDEIIDSINSLSKALGPSGANASGALSQLLHSAAVEFDDQGPNIHTTVSSFGQALGALSSNASDVTQVIDNLGTLTQAAANASGTYESFASDLATVSTALNGDSSSITTALSTLQQALSEVATFVQTNAHGITGSVSNLEQVAAALGQQQQQLAGLLSAAPLALQNLSAAYDPAAPDPVAGDPTHTTPALKSRLDVQPNATPYLQSICGNTILRLLVVSLNNVENLHDPITGMDLACGVSATLQALPVLPGASGPNLSLNALLQAASQ
jgi:virulence factor Mce-like protein